MAKVWKLLATLVLSFLYYIYFELQDLEQEELWVLTPISIVANIKSFLGIGSKVRSFCSSLVSSDQSFFLKLKMLVLVFVTTLKVSMLIWLSWSRRRRRRTWTWQEYYQAELGVNWSWKIKEFHIDEKLCSVIERDKGLCLLKIVLTKFGLIHQLILWALVETTGVGFANKFPQKPLLFDAAFHILVNLSNLWDRLKLVISISGFHSKVSKSCYILGQSTMTIA